MKWLYNLVIHDLNKICFDIFQNRDDVIFVVFALINVVWSTLYLEHWKRRSAEFAYQWGTLDKEDELLVEPRSLFKVRNPEYGKRIQNHLHINAKENM